MIQKEISFITKSLENMTSPESSKMSTRYGLPLIFRQNNNSSSRYHAGKQNNPDSEISVLLFGAYNTQLKREWVHEI